MARQWYLSGSPLLITLLFSAPFIALVITGTVKIPGLPLAVTGFQAAAFDQTTSLNTNTAYSCDPKYGDGWFSYGGPLPVNYPCQQTTSPNTISPASTTQAFSLTTAVLGSDSNDGGLLTPLGNHCVPNNIGSPSCAHASAYLSGLGLSGVLQYPYNLIDQNFQNLYGEPVPLVNPFYLGNFTFSNTNYAGYLFEYGFAIRLQIVNDVPVMAYFCNPSPVGASRCQPAEQGAATDAFTFINSRDSVSGTVAVDITVPNTLVTGPSDRLSIIGAWTSAGGCPLISQLQYGGIITIQQCSSHVIIPIKNLPYAPFQYQAVTSYTTNQLQNIAVAGGFSTVTALITINKMAVKYNSACNGDCGSATTGDPIVQADMTPNSLQVDVPIIFDLLDVTPNIPPTGSCGGLIPNCPQPHGNFGAVAVHVQDSFTTLPLRAMSIALIGTTAGGCSSATSYSAQTDKSGNYNFTAVGAGTYLVCASGGSGLLQLFFFTTWIQYNQAQQQVTTVVGKTNAVTLSLQPNLYGQLTWVAILLIVVAMFFLIVGVSFKLRPSKSIVEYRSVGPSGGGRRGKVRIPGPGVGVAALGRGVTGIKNHGKKK
jgi:hypothetical protein